MKDMICLPALPICALFLLLLQTSHANPPLVLPYTPDYDGDYDLFGGENYATNDDNLMLYSLTRPPHTHFTASLTPLPTSKGNSVVIIFQPSPPPQ